MKSWTLVASKKKQAIITRIEKCQLNTIYEQNMQAIIIEINESMSIASYKVCIEMQFEFVFDQVKR